MNSFLLDSFLDYILVIYSGDRPADCCWPTGRIGPYFQKPMSLNCVIVFFSTLSGSVPHCSFCLFLVTDKKTDSRVGDARYCEIILEVIIKPLLVIFSQSCLLSEKHRPLQWRRGSIYQSELNPNVNSLVHEQILFLEIVLSSSKKPNYHDSSNITVLPLLNGLSGY